MATDECFLVETELLRKALYETRIIPFVASQFPFFQKSQPIFNVALRYIFVKLAYFAKHQLNSIDPVFCSLDNGNEHPQQQQQQQPHQNLAHDPWTLQMIVHDLKFTKKDYEVSKDFEPQQFQQKLDALLRECAITVKDKLQSKSVPPDQPIRLENHVVRGPLIWYGNGSNNGSSNVAFDDICLLAQKHPLFANQALALQIRYQYMRLENHGLAMSYKDTLNLSPSDGIEGFASAFNHYFDRFCSAFPDLESCFGSLGNFFHVFPDQAEARKWYINPPFDVTIFDQVVIAADEKCQKWSKSNSSEFQNGSSNNSDGKKQQQVPVLSPLCLMFIGPDWVDFDAMEKLKSSRWAVGAKHWNKNELPFLQHMVGNHASKRPIYPCKIWTVEWSSHEKTTNHPISETNLTKSSDALVPRPTVTFETSAVVQKLLTQVDFPVPIRDMDYAQCFRLLQKEQLHLDITQCPSYNARFRDSKIRSQLKCLGTWKTTARDLSYSTALLDKFTRIHKSQCKDHNAQMSAYEYWRQYKQEIVQVSIETYLRYCSTTTSGNGNSSETNMKKSKVVESTNTNENLIKDSESDNHKKFHANTESIDFDFARLENECAWRMGEVMDLSYAPFTVFSACVAAQVIRRLRSTKILDLCAGLGERLLAACALDCEYWSCHSNADLCTSLGQMIAEYGTLTKQTVHNQSFEEVQCVPPHSQYDLLLSAVDQKHLDNHSIQYWHNLLQKADKFLRPGAWICLQMCDILVADEQKQKQQQQVKQDRKRKWAETSTAKHTQSIVQFQENARRRIEPRSEQAVISSSNVYMVEPTLLYCKEQLGWLYQGTLGYSKLRPEEHLSNFHPATPLWMFQKHKLQQKPSNKIN